jgi:hypothetical protein
MERFFHGSKLVLCSSAILLSSASCFGQSSVPGDDSSKAFEVAASLAQSLDQLTIAIIGGSIAVLLTSSTHRPGGWIRWAYFLFIPGWVSLGYAVYRGIQVQRVFLAYHFFPNPNLASLRLAINRDAYFQIQSLLLGLFVFGVWLFLYLIWWIFAKENDKKGAS